MRRKRGSAGSVDAGDEMPAELVEVPAFAGDHQAQAVALRAWCEARKAWRAERGITAGWLADLVASVEARRHRW